MFKSEWLFSNLLCSLRCDHIHIIEKNVLFMKLDKKFHYPTIICALVSILISSQLCLPDTSSVLSCTCILWFWFSSGCSVFSCIKCWTCVGQTDFRDRQVTSAHLLFISVPVTLWWQLWQNLNTDDIKLQEESNQFVPVDYLSFYPSEMKSSGQNVEVHFLASWELEEMMRHSTERATAPGKVEADVLLTFQIISLILIRAHRSVRIACFGFIRVTRTSSLTPPGGLDLEGEQPSQIRFSLFIVQSVLSTLLSIHSDSTVLCVCLFAPLELTVLVW